MGFYLKFVIIFRSFGRVIIVCLKNCRDLINCSWIMMCFDNRWKILKIRICCFEFSCGIMD